MTTHDGDLRQNAIVGLVLFLQYWYWYPMMNFLSLALTPTTLIAVNHQLKVPKNFKMHVKANPKYFAYPEMIKKQDKGEKKKVETAVLSTTSKVAARLKSKKSLGGPEEPNQSKDVEMASEV